MMKEKKKKYNEIALFGKTNLVCIKVLFSSFLTRSYIECDYRNLINVLTKQDHIKEKINKVNKKLWYTYRTMSSDCLMCRNKKLKGQKT